MSTACQKNFTITVNPAVQPTTMAYWAMQGPNPLLQLSSVGTPALALGSLDPTQSLPPGVIGQCLQCLANGGSGFAIVSTNIIGVAELYPPSGSWTTAFWVRHVDGVIFVPSLPYSSVAYSNTFGPFGVGFHIDSDATTGNWVLTFDTGVQSTFTKAGDGGTFQFHVMTYDAVTGDMTWEINRAGKTTLNHAPVVGNIGTTGGAAFNAVLGDLADTQITAVDEWGVWEGILTDPQLDYLYNAGAGRTWPLVFP